MNRLASWWNRLLGNGYFLYFRSFSLTGRWEVGGLDNLVLARNSGRPLLWCFWHGQALNFMAYADRHEDNSTFTAVAVAGDRGDVLSTLGNRLKADSYNIDMEGSSMAAGRRLLNLIKEMKGGRQAVIAPDGPDGPAFVAKNGVGFLARKAKAAVVPMGIWTRHAYQLNRWDRYMLPVPWARFYAYFAPPVIVNRGMDADKVQDEISAAMTAARHEAQRMAGVEPWPQGRGGSY